MSFEYSSWIPLALIVCFIFSAFVVRNRRKYYEILEKYWFFKPSQLSKLRLITFIISFILLFWALLDLRGPEERIKATIPDQKTIIIIDASASMLAEDVRPNRFQRSIFLARHFIKRAAGHQIAVVLFSDTQKRLVPFTDDIDLLDARVAALEKTELRYGNSNINQAVKESLQYFKIDNESEKTVGNILLFTDSEEHGGVFTLDEGTEVNLAVIGVGTAAGAPIPLRSKSGVFLDYKKYKGEKVITKLNEDAIKKMGSDFKNFKYWVATSYIIPTDEILTFFRGIYKKKLGETDIRIRPVYGHFIIILSVFIYFISSLLGLGRSLSKPLVAICLILLTGKPSILSANENTLELTKRTRKLKSGVASSDEKKFVAQELLRTGKAKESSVLFQEINSGKQGDINSLVNMGTAYASSGNLIKALESYEKASQLMPAGTEKEKLQDIIRSNTLAAITKKKQKSKGKKQKKDKKDQKKKKDNQDKKSESGKSSEDKKDKSNKDNKSTDKKNKPSDDKEKQKKKNDKEKKKENKKDENKEPQEKKAETQPSSLEEKEKQIKKKRKMVKIPAMLKQIMDQDRNLQQKYYKTNEKRKRRNTDRRDW